MLFINAYRKLYLFCMDYEQIKERIKKERRAQGYTQEFMAESLGISTNSYREIESGKTQLINPRLREISKILGVSMETLIFGYIPKDDFLTSIEDIQILHNKEISDLKMAHKIELAERDGEIKVLKASLETKDSIIGVLKEKRYDY